MTKSGSHRGPEMIKNEVQKWGPKGGPRSPPQNPDFGSSGGGVLGRGSPGGPQEGPQEVPRRSPGGSPGGPQEGVPRRARNPGNRPPEVIFRGGVPRRPNRAPLQEKVGTWRTQIGLLEGSFSRISRILADFRDSGGPQEVLGRGSPGGPKSTLGRTKSDPQEVPK